MLASRACGGKRRQSSCRLTATTTDAVYFLGSGNVRRRFTAYHQDANGLYLTMLVVKEGFKQSGVKTNSHDRRQNLAALAGASLPNHCSSEAWLTAAGRPLHLAGPSGKLRCIRVSMQTELTRRPICGWCRARGAAAGRRRRRTSRCSRQHRSARRSKATEYGVGRRRHSGVAAELLCSAAEETIDG